ncbi:hypothetical protein [Nocardia wallacei]|uniref:hypothetical protein n=1 Tax=Nocardia wallacei TaxID=480035 RepID=UPI002458C747|nr:hypothetical protein [Nocardia wallacei]
MPDITRARFVEQTTPDPVLVQVLAGKDAWSKLSKPQRRLLEGHLTVRDEAARRPFERFAISASPVEAPDRTVRSLRAKGVIDDDNRLTWVGVYALLWGPSKDEAVSADA